VETYKLEDGVKIETTRGRYTGLEFVLGLIHLVALLSQTPAPEKMCVDRVRDMWRKR
jgi:hypothetical protein